MKKGLTWKINLVNEIDFSLLYIYKKTFVLSYLSNFNKPKTSDHATTITFICCLGYLLYFYIHVNCELYYRVSLVSIGILVFELSLRWIYYKHLYNKALENYFIFSYIEWEWFWEIQEKKNWKGMEIEICGMKKNITKALLHGSLHQ